MQAATADRLEGAFYTSPNKVAAVRPITLTLDRGEVVALVGENGAGKSTARPRPGSPRGRGCPHCPPHEAPWPATAGTAWHKSARTAAAFRALPSLLLSLAPRAMAVPDPGFDVSA
ncbi:ATP-binding cassette domain-containing protein [Streptomyces bobili]|uniref:ATP-binding cassette domain-containing protein n=1 Tax=Streptomyces bobili TaxID=67280 RepID=UPI0033B08B31